jgi:hypothetical protein
VSCARCPFRLPRRNSGETCQNLLILPVRLPGRQASRKSSPLKSASCLSLDHLNPRPQLSNHQNGDSSFDAFKIGRQDLLPHNLLGFTPRHLDGASISPNPSEPTAKQGTGPPGGGCITSAGNANCHKQPQPLVHGFQGPPFGRQRRPQD